MKRKISRNINLTEGSILQGILYFAIPLLLTNFLQQLYNTADLMIVGRYAGKNPMAAVGATGHVSNLMIGLFLGLTTGASVVISRYYGSNDREHLKKAVHCAYFLALISGLFITIVGYWATPTLLRLLETPPEILEEATSYMRIFFLGTTPLLVYNMGASILRSVGDSRRPFHFLCISAMANILLDFVLIAGLKLSILGAGWATFTAQLIASLLVSFNLIKSDRLFRLQISRLGLYSKEAKKIFKIGIPTGIQSSLISLANVIIQAKINTFGSDAIAGIAAEGRIDGFIFMSLQAVALAATTFAGQNYGAGKKERIATGLKVTTGIIVTLAALLSAVAILFARPLIGIFNSSEEVIYYGARMLMIVSLCTWMFGTSEVMGGFIRGAGQAMGPMIISLLCICVFRTLWIFQALKIWNSIDIIFLSYPLSYTLNLVTTILYYRLGRWKRQL